MKRLPSTTVVDTVSFSRNLDDSLLGQLAQRLQMPEEFGDRYREYQERVPMFIPRFEAGRPKEA